MSDILIPGLDATKILAGTTILGVAGSIANNGGVILTPSEIQQSIVAGYHDGTGHVNPVTMAAGNNQIWSDQQQALGSGGGTVMAQVWTKVINYGGVVRVNMYIRSNSGGSVRAQIYKNGSAYGTLQTMASTTPLLVTTDVTVVAGDTIQVYGGANAGSGDTLLLWGMRFCIAANAYLVMQ